MSDSEDITSYSNEDNITHDDHLEFSSLHASLISDVEGEEIVIEYNSAPSSPSSLAFRDISPLRTASAPSSPARSGSSVIPRTSSVKALVDRFEINPPSIMASNAKKEAAEDIRKIGHCKGWVTRYLNKLETLLVSGKDVLDSIDFKSVSEQIETQCDKILTYRNSIDDIYATHNADAAFKTVYDDIDLFLINTNQKVNDYALKVARGAEQVVPAPDNITKAELLKAMSQLGNEHIKINVDTPNFLGDEKDKLEFKHWYDRIDAIVKGRPNWSEEYKFFFLKTKVQKNAAAFINHIEPGAGAYDLCMDALKEQYLNESYIVNEYFKKLLSDQPKFDETYLESKTYIANTRNHLHNLKNYYGVDLMDETNGAHKFLSHVIFSKFSVELRQAFKWELKVEYPTFDQILKSYCKVTTHLDNLREVPSQVSKPIQPSGKSDKSSKHKSRYKFNKFNKSDKYVNSDSSYRSEPNYNTQVALSKGGDRLPFKKHCRFCSSDQHNSVDCPTYATYQTRFEKCKELHLCLQCTSPQHKVGPECPASKTGPGSLYKDCRYCGKRNHVSAICKKLKPPLPVHACLSTHVGRKSNFLLPILAIKFEGRGGRTVTFNALVDTGSSRSYINPKVAQILQIGSDYLTEVEYNVRTFLGSGLKKLAETSLTVYLPSGRYLSLPMFVDSQFKLELEVRGLNKLVHNLNKLKFNLGTDYTPDSDAILIDGLLGMDVLQFVQFATVPCMSGQALRMADKFIPFGNSSHFLYHDQLRSMAKDDFVETHFSTIIANVQCPEQVVNNCVEPKSFYIDGLAPLFDESSIERNIERMVNCDSLASSSESPDLSTYDLEKIKQFESSIEIKDSIYVELVWKENISEVPSNFEVALKVLERVYSKLDRTGNLDKYNKVFFDQLNSGIIEEFVCAPKDFGRHIWLPHRPVIKEDAQTTTKIRPVFNCSLKTRKDKPSLNEASYQGVNIMSNMLHLLLKFRTNSKVLLGDLEKAFLQIKLKLMRDKNRFCFFLKDGDRIRCFRYNTLLFGYVCSPFILNFVLKHIAGLHPRDECSQMMLDNFFVDNLIVTSNSSEKLANLYRECSARLSEVHFNLQSCNTNSNSLKALMLEDDKFIKHGCLEDKVLGYKYEAAIDQIRLSHVNINADANTKRKIFSESAKIFDPISFSAPVLVRSKILISTLWEETGNDSGHWDSPVSEESLGVWSHLAGDLQQLSTLGFDRQAFSSEEDMALFIFSDASKRAYGYVVYSVQNCKSNFVFAKAKTAPLKHKRSVPQLELLAAKLSLQGLFTLLSCFSNVNNVYIGVDAQIVLAWLTSPISTKNVYTANRIKDTIKLIADVKREFNIKVQLKYVPTSCNPADLLTRGLSFQQFQENLDFWLKGPQFIRSDVVVWPSADLKCLSDASKTVVCAALAEAPDPNPPLVSFTKYSSLPKLLNVIKVMIKFLIVGKVLKEETMMRLWGTAEPLEIAKFHLIARMQEESFPVELKFLRGKEQHQVPDRVRDLNLFLDPKGLIRSEGRMENVNAFSSELIHPLLLGKNHPLTNLIVLYCHHKVQHLGVQPTLNKVRMDGFRLIHPFNAVKSVLKNCYTCKRMNSLAFKYPKMTDLPAHRVNLIRPFAHTGVDYTGHIMIREGDVDKEYYMLIFTCLNVRACHIELLPDMSAKHFVLALVRFSNQYGIPENIYSDNAANFAAGVPRLSKVFESQIFQENFGTTPIRHLCIPLGAPWVGACWERMIKLIKECLRKTVVRQKLDYFKLVTVLSDIQHAVNNRPLTYRCADNHSLEVITPYKFLNPYGSNTVLVQNTSAEYSRSKSSKELAESLELRDKLMDRFRDVWQREYLLSLRDGYKDLRQEHFVDKVDVGDIVLVRNIQPKYVKRRQYWSLARILSVIKGHDGKIRSATVLKGSADYLRRKREPEVHPVNHLYPLELNLTHEYRSSLPDIEVVPEDVNPNLDFSNYEEAFDAISEEPVLQDSDHVATDRMEPSSVPAAPPSDLNLPTSDLNLPTTSHSNLPNASSDSNLPSLEQAADISNLVAPDLTAAPSVQYNRRGRAIKPPPGHADFIRFV